MKKTTLKLTLISQIFFGIFGFQNASFADTTPREISNFQVPMHNQVIDNLNLSFSERLKMSLGDSRFVKNASGALILNVQAGEIADLVYAKLGSSAQIWSSYNESSALGHIQVVKAIKQAGKVSVQIWDFSPKIAGKQAVADKYHEVDPYLEFQSASDDLWHNISFSAFLTCVSKAQMKHRTAIAMTAIADVKQEEMQTSSDGLLQTSTTTTISTRVKPRWIASSSAENGGAQAFTTQFLIPSSRCNAITDPRKCVVSSGANFVFFDGGNMETAQYIADTQSYTQSGFTMLANLLITAALAYAGGLAYGLNSASVGALATAAPSLSAGALAGYSALAYAGMTTALNGGNLCVTCRQNAWLGSTTGSQMPTAAGFGNANAAINSSFVNPSFEQGSAAQQAQFLRNRQKTWDANHDPAYMQNNPNLRQNLMQNWIQNPVR